MARDEMLHCTTACVTSSSPNVAAGLMGNVLLKKFCEVFTQQQVEPGKALRELGSLDTPQQQSPCGGTLGEPTCNLRSIVGHSGPLRRSGGHSIRACTSFGGLGADAAGRVHHPGRTRRRRRHHGAHHPGHRHQAQLDEAADGGDQQGRRRRRRGLPRRQELQGQPAQDHHHPVEPVHHADGDRHSVQLEGPHSGRDAGARRVRALGQRREALQDRQGVRRRRQGRERHVQDGRHRLQAGRPDHHRGDPEGRPAPSSSTFRSAAAARWRCSWSAITSIRASTIRTRQSRTGAPASSGRSACSTASSSTTPTRSPATCPGTASRPASRRASTSNT